jgi:single stranded DNA-binding protein
MRIITFDGRLGKDAQILTTKNGKQYMRFSVANNLYTSKEERTDWFDVTCYDEFALEKKAKFLTKGTYVIITGSIVTEVKQGQDGRSWINHYVTATAIDLPRFGKPQDNTDNESAPAVSVYTAGTPSQRVETRVPEPEVPTMRMPEPQYYAPENSTDDYSGDLPF